MEIILREDFPSLGYVGDKVKVRRGYARNFLIPRGIGVEASSHNDRLLKHIVTGITAKRTRLKAQAEEIGKKLESAKLDFVLKAGDKGKSFGSITVKDVEAMLKSQGHVVDRKQIRLSDAIRKAGEYKALIKLHSEVTISIPIKVVLENTTAARKVEAGEEVGPGDKPKRKKSSRKKVEGEADSQEAAPADAAADSQTDEAKKPAAKKAKKSKKDTEAKEAE